MTARPYAEAIEEVKARVDAAQTSFHAGMSILPKERREAMYAFYAFCREVDDIADESASTEEAVRGLQEWRARIKGVFRGVPTDAITSALKPHIKTYSLAEQDFLSVIDGMEMDVEPIVGPDEETLDQYCDRVASAVGRVSVRIFGADSEDAMMVAHHLGRALQKTNILRDLAEDAQRNRLYLPNGLLIKHNISTRDPAEVLKSPSLPALCREFAAEAKNHYKQANAYMKKCPRAAMRPARIMRDYYSAILARLMAGGWKNPEKRISLPKWKKIVILLKSMVG
ncbi:MAG: presqualene diphosphate synthase HpnD [Alphaproteobacteria bacterium]|nr:presqualene diphosphate synthase HpnD [Alphaproteobacteria bacterium]